MISDLFAAQGRLEKIPIVGGEVYYLNRLELPLPDDELLRGLISSVPWRAESVTVWGKKYLQPRLIAWYGDDGKQYKYSGIDLAPLPWTEILATIKITVEKISKAVFNSALLNYYRNNLDGMGLHSDDEPELGHQPVIASVSLGAERTFVLKSKVAHHERTLRLKLASGSLLLMKGDTQRNWKHGIPKDSKRCGPRVNLTFRQIFPRQ